MSHISQDIKNTGIGEKVLATPPSGENQTKREEITKGNVSEGGDTPNFVGGSTMQRLHAAVKKEPSLELYNRASDAEGQNMSSSSKGKLNSILQRMTGFREKKQEPVKDPKLSPSVHRSEAIVPNQKVIRDSEELSLSTEQRRKEEVPAFLRRQAN